MPNSGRTPAILALCVIKAMIKYNSTSGKESGVTAYEVGDTFIKVRFQGMKTYTYTEFLNGKELSNT